MRIAPVILCLVLLLAPGLALAANEVKVTGDTFEINEDIREAVFTGNVVVVHPTLDLWADKVVIEYGEGGTSDIETFLATGKVKIKNAKQTATGDQAVYDPATQILRLTGNVIVEQDATVVSSPELMVNMQTNTSVFTSGSGGRVTGIFGEE